jgi:hypothetical protein
VTPLKRLLPRGVFVSVDGATALDATSGARLSHVFGAGVSSDDAGFAQRDRVYADLWELRGDDDRLG